MDIPYTTVAVLTFALALKPLIIPFCMSLSLAPADKTIGKIPVLSQKELSNSFAGKKALLIGGTRGVGYGTALAIAQAGADVTLVGRSEKSGAAALDKIRAATHNEQQRLDFVQGDLGSLQSASELVETLVSRPERYDYLVVSAMTFPDWSASTLRNEDGFDQSYFIGVIGRFIIYRNMHKFLRGDNSHVLNVLAAGAKPMAPLDRELASGQRVPTSLMDDISTISLANDIMLIGLEVKDLNISGKTTLVSTHPGFLKTDLHRGQGLFFDVVEWIMVSLVGISEEDCGVRQASILTSDKLHEGNLSYVDMFLKGRERSSQLQAEVDENLEWMWSLLTGLEAKANAAKENTTAFT